MPWHRQSPACGRRRRRGNRCSDCLGWKVFRFGHSGNTGSAPPNRSGAPSETEVSWPARRNFAGSARSRPGAGSERTREDAIAGLRKSRHVQCESHARVLRTSFLSVPGRFRGLGAIAASRDHSRHARKYTPTTPSATRCPPTGSLPNLASRRHANVMQPRSCDPLVRRRPPGQAPRDFTSQADNSRLFSTIFSRSDLLGDMDGNGLSLSG